MTTAANLPSAPAPTTPRAPSTPTATGSTTYPDGTILRGSGPGVYVMQSGVRRWVPDPETFNGMRLDWNTVRRVPDALLTAIPAGPQIPHGATSIPPLPAAPQMPAPPAMPSIPAAPQMTTPPAMPSIPAAPQMTAPPPSPATSQMTAPRPMPATQPAASPPSPPAVSTTAAPTAPAPPPTTIVSPPTIAPSTPDAPAPTPPPTTAPATPPPRPGGGFGYVTCTAVSDFPQCSVHQHRMYYSGILAAGPRIDPQEPYMHDCLNSVGVVTNPAQWRSGVCGTDLTGCNFWWFDSEQRATEHRANAMARAPRYGFTVASCR